MTYFNSDMIKAESLKSIIWEIPYLDGGGAVLSRLNELEKSLSEIQKELEKAPLKYAPPVGTYLYSTNNPALTWAGTTWTKIEEGTYLTAAGSSYSENTNYGSNSITLTESHLPRHTHTGPSHSHTMAHTHAGPSHTHSVSGTTASAGSHSHKALMRYGWDWTGTANQWSTGSSNQSGNWYLQTESAGAHTHIAYQAQLPHQVLVKQELLLRLVLAHLGLELQVPQVVEWHLVICLNLSQSLYENE